MRTIGIYLIAIAIFCSCNSSKELTTESGLKYTILQKGDGPAIEDGKKIRAHCILALEDGTPVWNTREDDKVFEYVVGQMPMIAGWNEITFMMRKGDRYKVIIPPDLGYGAAGRLPAIPGNSTLVFDIEVLDVLEP